MSRGSGRILVVGMHRSGTSALSGLLVKMGAYFGPPDQQLPTKKANPKGYWERWDVVLANDALLQERGLEWHRVSTYKSDLFDPVDSSSARKHLGVMIDDSEQHQPWFVKDPRICLTLPYWLSQLKNPVCVLVARDPLQVAYSLQSRGDCSAHVGLALWETYTGAALWHSRNCRRIILHYEELLKSPQAELERLLAFLEASGVRGMTLPPSSDIQSWLDTNLQREHVQVSQTADFLNQNQKKLFDALLDGSALSWTEPWRVSTGGQAALSAFESQYLALLKEKNDQTIALSKLQAEVDTVRKFKQDLYEWNRDLEKCTDVLAGSLTFRTSRRIVQIWHRLRGRKPPPTPVDRLRDIIAAQRTIKGLGESKK